MWLGGERDRAGSWDAKRCRDASSEGEQAHLDGDLTEIIIGRAGLKDSGQRIQTSGSVHDESIGMDEPSWGQINICSGESHSIIRSVPT